MLFGCKIISQKNVKFRLCIKKLNGKTVEVKTKKKNFSDYSKNTMIKKNFFFKKAVSSKRLFFNKGGNVT